MIVQILKRKIGENPTEWVELLPEVMWAYRTTIKTLMGHTPFALVFGLKVVAPLEHVWPSARIIGYDEEQNKTMQLLEEDL